MTDSDIEKKRMTKIDALHQKWLENPDYQKAYDELAPEFDAEARFQAQALRGQNARGLELLDKVDRHFGRRTEI